MSVEEKINEIIKNKCDNYNSVYGRKIMKLHAAIRQVESNEKFLKYLEDSEHINPRPVYQLPNLNTIL